MQNMKIFNERQNFCVRFPFISTISIGTIECVFVNVFRASFLKGIVKWEIFFS